MSSRSFRILLAVVVGLVLAMWALDVARERGGGDSDGELLLPGLAEDANAAGTVTITAPGDAGTTVLAKSGDDWTVLSRAGYHADVGKLRLLVVALSEARIVEEKTADPERYARLGVDDPDAEGDGTRIAIEGDGFAHSVILGNTAQGDYRYARVPGDDTSYLIDRDPDLPESAGDWLVPEVLDIGAGRVHKVTISHADGEAVVIEKSAPDLTDFSVRDIPAGRELSYATIGNGVAGALGNLALDDVRRYTSTEPATRTEFLTWDGLRVEAAVTHDGDDRWVAFTVADTEPPPAEADDGDEEPPTPPEDVGRLAERLAGWEYRLPDHKTNLLVRRWEDLLKDVDSEAD